MKGDTVFVRAVVVLFLVACCFALKLYQEEKGRA